MTPTATAIIAKEGTVRIGGAYVVARGERCALVTIETPDLKRPQGTTTSLDGKRGIVIWEADQETRRDFGYATTCFISEFEEWYVFAMETDRWALHVAFIKSGA